ncbi:DUF2218 domain-containing protein [Aliihoeflea sp. PC F10.4]
MPGTRTTVSTQHASRYLQQLCKHWTHKFETEFTPNVGRIAISPGEARLAADEARLSIEVTAPEGADLNQLRDVVQSHIERFAFRETLSFDWQPISTAEQTPPAGNARTFNSI